MQFRALGLLLQVEFRAHTLHIRRLKMELLLVRLRYASQYSIFRILTQLAARCGGKTCIDFRKVMCYTI